ncbi:acyl carrier protein [Streptomyces sp. NPDC049555]|uniref:acyl carrier protein n=1 Tax=unclassified Streptomyces TaxID=2593676 RepID=UPI0034494576
MAELSLTELEEIMRQSTGEAEAAAPSADDCVTFEELGFDSLALLEVVNRIERTYDIKLPEDGLEEIRTPRALVAFVNDRLRETV